MPKPDLRAVSSELPDPPYPADTRAKGMGLNIKNQDVRNTKAWRLVPPELKSCLLRLWFESWDSVPAGTLDDDDELIASQIDMPLAQFQIHKEALMRGWVRHSDGLLYHPVMTERTLEVIAWREKNAEKQRRFRKKRQPEDVASKSPVSNRVLTGQSPGSNLPSTSTSPSPSPSSSKEKNIGQKSAEPTKKASAGDGCQGHSASDRHGFEEFWRIWPKKVARKPAMSAWTRLTKTKKKAVLNHLARNPFDGKDMQFVPNPATFLNGERWLDETSAKTSAAQHMVGAI